MILILPTLLYILFVIVSMFVLKRLTVKKEEAQRSKYRRRLLVTFIILFPFLFIYYILFLFNVGLSDHYNVKRGTFMWFITMDNETITEFPILDPVNTPTYNSIGGDSPNIGTGWEINYASKLDSIQLVDSVLSYLRNNGFELSETEQTNYYWIGKYSKNGNNLLFSGNNKKGEALDLLFNFRGHRISSVECSIVY